MAKNSKFDRIQVVDKAVDLYWEKGFYGTSMRNLQEVIDMRPGSIYAAFGSKEGLFKESLQRYTQLGITHLEQCCNEQKSPLLGLKSFIHHIVVEKRSSSPSGMCMLVKTVTELTNENEELLAEAKRSLKIMESEFEKVLKQAQEIGEIEKKKDTKQLAQFVQVQIAGLRTYARTVDSDLPLQIMLDNMFSHYPF
ncbi:TetR/AcrR family transcriptional regulator [Aliivibrio sp. S4TY2]|uniref:TetR/AcrR family transcriptional regulator n=1 Tax=unclassified Aliivibrio TaxID=2645654 RepID=UPI002379E255|nr:MULTISPECIES: TetR/AcrR family transcriptional regulator [unclassified Aliivibrio]MDD9158229.1 TetR/AcrR family transcriptional regulator [Aliivibrio sp. S4TY2]MDD9162144.1 TetR/AcrR family transcriptional regulator [Aliivibrio sp. S4TY1]MDD9166182.1 TetR/AcrR family transcriptional regulator [Aliivibrio sp. S4MY2]MDD9170180.1 TetR/AcrR family transcriptional regulator [Aliivibrio sp. S4MY4]MDD9187231.1 TetR/AcrR family transcriptional regulator [Aliivibrio sp. S4MY3]